MSVTNRQKKTWTRFAAAVFLALGIATMGLSTATTAAAGSGEWIPYGLYGTGDFSTCSEDGRYWVGPGSDDWSAWRCSPQYDRFGNHVHWQLELELIP